MCLLLRSICPSSLCFAEQCWKFVFDHIWWIFFIFFKVMHLIWKNLAHLNFFSISQWNHFTQNRNFRIGDVDIVLSQQEKWDFTAPIKTFHHAHPCAKSPVHYVLSMWVLDRCQIYNRYYKCILGNIAQPDSSSSGVNASLWSSGNPKSFTYWVSVQCS